MWKIKIQDPSGETRKIAIRKDCTQTLNLGNSENCEILLRDPTLPKNVAQIHVRLSTIEQESPFWIRLDSFEQNARLGDLKILESHWPAQYPLQVGESILTLEKHKSTPDLPTFPSQVRPWLTQAESGRKILWMAKKSATTPLSIYLGGETGTGKEVMAHLLHAWSDRASGAFIPINCGALPLALAESELFGHVKGAFTGASHQRPGALLQAHNGTVFLDEVGDLPLYIQVKLLRFLENGEIKAVGSDHTSRANVRVICATHKPLLQLVEEGKFRRDLYFRLASVPIEIPPLRSRPEDIELLAENFSQSLGRTLSERAILRLKAHHWPGNVRELRNAIERACGLSGPFNQTLEDVDFEFLLTPQNIQQNPQLNIGPILTLEEMERVMLLKALKLSQGNRAAAARILGIARSTLFEMIKRHRILGPKTKGFETEVA